VVDRAAVTFSRSLFDTDEEELEAYSINKILH